jgi:hypothetical protein
MAFNFRPTSDTEINKKKKTHSSVVAQIYNFVRTNYSSGIVLDPSSNFQMVKIPRDVEKTGVKLVTIKQKLQRAKIKLTGIEIQFGNGSGVGGSKIDAKTTAMQENATRYVCEQIIEKGKIPLGSDIAKIYPNYDDEWHATFLAQAKALKGFGIGRGYEYSRDQVTGMMRQIETIAMTKCGVSTKDNWNPADIYVVKTSKKRGILIELNKIGNLKCAVPLRLEALNDYMRKLFGTNNTNRELIGVSLKKLTNGKVKKIEKTNVTKLTTLDDISIKSDSIKLNLDLNAMGEFETGEMKLQLLVHGEIVDVQIRNFDVSKSRGKVQMDMTEAGAAAKLGKTSGPLAIDPFILKYNMKRREMNTIPLVGAWTEKNIKDFVAEFDDIKNTKIDGNGINYGKNDWETTLREAIELEKGNNRTASQLATKLQCFHWVRIFRKIDNAGDLKAFLTVLYFGAKKQYSTAGPFLKIS